MRRYLPHLATAAFALILVAGPFMSRFQRTMLMEVLIWGLFAAAFNVVYGYTGMLSFGQAIFLGVGAYSVTYPLVKFGVNPVWGLLLSLVLGALFALAVGLIAVRLTGHHFVVTTVTLCLIIFLIAAGAVSITGGNEGLSFRPPVLALGPLSFDLRDQIVNFYLVSLLVALSFWVLQRVVRSPVGLVFQALRDNERRVSLLGYNARAYKLYSFVIGGIFSSLAGALYALTFRSANAELFFWTKSGDAVAWALVGGAGSLGGPMLGAGLLVIFTDWLSGFTREYLLIVGIIIVLVARQAPMGIMGLIRRWLRLEP